MNHKKILKTLLLSFLTILFPCTMNTSQMYGPPSGQMMPMGPESLTPEDLQAMELAVEQERAKMTPEERAQFDSDVDQLTKELEAMKPEELDAFMNTVLFGQPQQPPMPEEIQPVAPEIKVEAPKPEPVKPKKPLKKQDEALNTIDGIINSTNSFLHKIARYIDFVGKLKKWSEQGKIPGWKPTYTWDGIKKEIESLLHTLNKMKDKDTKTNEYKYLSDLIDNESLYNNLNKLNDSLANLEPNIEVDEFEVDEFKAVTKESREFIRKVLAQYLEALYALDIPADLEKVIAKYEPTAKKMKEEEEKATKKVFEESKKKPKPVPAVVSGKGEKESSYHGGSSYGDSGMNPYDYYPYSSGYSSPYSSGYSSPYSGSSDTSYKGGSPSGSSAGGVAGKEGGTSEAGSGGGKGTSGGGGGKGVGHQDHGKGGHEGAMHRTQGQEKADKFIDEFEEALEDAIASIDEGKLTKVDEQLKQSASQNDDKKIVDALDETNLKVETVTAAIKKLKRFTLTEDQKKKVRTLYVKHKPKLDSALTSIKNVSPDKDKKEVDRAIKAATPSLSHLKHNIEMLQEQYEEIIIGKTFDHMAAKDEFSDLEAMTQKASAEKAGSEIKAPKVAAEHKPKTEKQQKVDKIISLFKNHLERALDALDDANFFTITKVQAKKLDDDTVDILDDANTDIGHAVDQINKLQRTSLTPDLMQKREISSMYAKHKRKLDAALAHIKKLYPEEEAKEKAEEEGETIEPALRTIETNIKKLHEKVDTLLTGKKK